jgi:hypothetical protein
VGNAAKKWIIDTGTSHHFCAHKEWYQMYKDLITNISTTEPSIQAEGVKTVQLPIEDYELALQNIIHMPDLPFNILSAERLKKNNLF